MALQSKDSKGQLFDQINASNPTLPVPLSSADVNLSTLKTISQPGTVINTEVGLFAKMVGLFRKYVFLRYRRLDFQTLFRGNAPVLYKYTSAPANASPFTVYQLLPYLNKIYGLQLTEDDVYDASFPIGDTTTTGYIGVRTSTVIVKAKPTSLGYVNQFVLRWVYRKQLVEDILPVADLPARQYPGGNDFTTHASVLNSEAYGCDFANVVDSLTAANAFNGTRTIGNAASIAQHQAVIDELNTQRGTSYTVDQANVGQPGNLYGAATATYTLPNAAVPEANSQYFNHVAIITPTGQDAGANVTGKLFLHYNA